MYFKPKKIHYDRLLKAAMDDHEKVFKTTATPSQSFTPSKETILHKLIVTNSEWNLNRIGCSPSL